jgi:hypothetical protein
LNAAYQCLKEPRERVKHLLELESGTKGPQVQNIPEELMDCSLAVAQLCRQVDAFLGEKASTTSPLLQVPFFERGQEWREKADRFQHRLRQQREELLNELKSLDRQWIKRAEKEADVRNSLLSRLGELSGLLGYFDKWLTQLRERLVQLSL